MWNYLSLSLEQPVQKGISGITARRSLIILLLSRISSLVVFCSCGKLVARLSTYMWLVEGGGQSACKAHGDTGDDIIWYPLRLRQAELCYDMLILLSIVGFSFSIVLVMLIVQQVLFKIYRNCLPPSGSYVSVLPQQFKKHTTFQ